MKEYRRTAWLQGAIDLSDLIRKAVETLQAEETHLERIKNQYKAIAVDEFQDINSMQYKLVNLLATGRNLLAIGDPNQAIYGFRGSDLEHFFRFSDDFNAQEISLVQNYRSTGTLLEAADALISHNTNPGKTRLKSQKGSGYPIQVFNASNPFGEADYILAQIKYYIGGTDSLTTGTHTDSEHEYGFNDIAILFRTHSVGRRLFKSIIESGIPVQMGDGSAFLSEPPFTIVSSWLRLYLKPENSVALSNLLTTVYEWKPQQTTSLLSLLKGSEHSLFGSATINTLPKPHKNDIEELQSVFQQLTRKLESNGIKAGVECICNRYIPDECLDEKTLLKKETLLELAGEATDNVESFLDQMQLNPYTDAGRLKTDGVHLLTFHAAKGLEFPVVFIAGAEEEVTPLQKADSNLEEERRLFYVGLTRAKEILHISWSKERSIYGYATSRKASRFITEIPERLLSSKRVTSATDNIDRQQQLRLF